MRERRKPRESAGKSWSTAWSSMNSRSRQQSARIRTEASGGNSGPRKAAMRITLGVTGGVAAYKAAELVRRLQQDGFSVQVVMTHGAREFVTPFTFAALSGQKVISDLFGDSSGGQANLASAIAHIPASQRTDLLLAAPATADIIAQHARGNADDFSSR